MKRPGDVACGIAIATLTLSSCRHYLEEPTPDRTADYFRVHLGTQSQEHLGSAVCGVGDWNGDGRADYAIGARGDARIISGASGKELLRLAAPQDSSGFGAALCLLNDVDGDGRRDFAVSAPGDPPRTVADGPERRLGLVEIRSGQDGRLLRTLRGPPEASEFGRTLAHLEDTENPAASLLLAANSRCQTKLYYEPIDAHVPTGAIVTAIPAFVLAFRCEDGEVAYRFEGPDGRWLSPDVARCGDVDGDGFPDFTATGENALHVASGRSGRILRTVGLELNEGHAIPSDDRFDFDRDNIPDHAVAEFVFETMRVDGRVEVFSGRDGSRLWSTRCHAFDAAWSNGAGGERVLAVTGTRSLALFRPPGPNPISTLALSGDFHFRHIATVGDVDGDGLPDFALSDDSDGGWVGILSSETVREALRR